MTVPRVDAGSHSPISTLCQYNFLFIYKHHRVTAPKPFRNIYLSHLKMSFLKLFYQLYRDVAAAGFRVSPLGDEERIQDNLIESSSDQVDTLGGYRGEPRTAMPDVRHVTRRFSCQQPSQPLRGR